MTIKVFLFQFVNSYASLFYIAFAKGGEDGEGCLYDNNCMNELAMQLGMIFATNLVFNTVELGYPYLIGKWTLYKQTKKLKELDQSITPMHIEEIESKKEMYETPLDDYMEIVISFGYVVLFGVAFPFVTVITLFLSVIELRVDAWKLCNLYMRPFPYRAKDIGVWANIMQVLTIAGAITNTALVMFTANIFHFEEEQTTLKWILFLLIEHGLIVFKLLLAVYIPNIPTKVKLGLIWSQRIVNERLFNRLTDTDQERTLQKLKFTKGAGHRTLTFREILDQHR